MTRAWVDIMNETAEAALGTSLVARDGRVIPKTEDVANSQAVKVSATFLYADLAGSARIAAVCPWDTTAKIIRAYLACATRLIRAYKGEIRSFDGDRVMGIFIGDFPNTWAANCAREIFWTTENVIQPKAEKKFKSVRDNNVKIRQACGVDCGDTRAVRAGIRDNSDLIWIGKPPSFAAKLSDLREFPYCTFLSSRSYNKLAASAKESDGKTIWEESTTTIGGQKETIYRSKYMKKP